MSETALSLLQLLALVAFVRASLPPKYLLLNPFAAWADRLFDKLLAALHSALFLPPRALSVVVLGMALSARAALLHRVSTPSLAVDFYAIYHFPAQGFLGWFAVAAGQFLWFWWGLVTAAWLFKLLHRAKTLPGYSGDLLAFVTRPFSLLPRALAAPVLLAGWVGLIALCQVAADQVLYPLGETEQVVALFRQWGVANPFDLAPLPVALRLTFLAGAAVLSLLTVFRSLLFITFILGLVAALVKSRSLTALMDDLMRLLGGFLPVLRLGPLNVSPILAYFVYGVLSTILGGAWIFLIQGVARVV